MQCIDSAKKGSNITAKWIIFLDYIFSRLFQRIPICLITLKNQDVTNVWNAFLFDFKSNVFIAESYATEKHKEITIIILLVITSITLLFCIFLVFFLWLDVHMYMTYVNGFMLFE